MRVGVIILPDQRWSEAARKWRAVESMGFAHAWTYDHLGWRSLVDGPWFDAAVTLTAAASVTSTIRLGTMVASPHFRDPVSFARVLTGLDDVSNGRFTLGVGAGAVGPVFDATVLGRPVLAARDRTRRFGEFLTLLDKLLREERVTWQGEHYAAVDARSTPGCLQEPRVPFVVAANGPRGRALAAQFGQGWVTTGSVDTSGVGPAGGDAHEAWWRGVGESNAALTESLIAAGRDPSTVDRFISVDASGIFSLTSVDAFVDALGRATEAGFTDLLTHWPRASEWYVGDEAILETVAAQVLPTLR